MNAIAVLYIDEGRLAKAAPMLEEATLIFEQRGETEDEYFAILLTNRGDLAIKQGRIVDAERDFRRALAIRAVPRVVHDRSLRGTVVSLCLQERFEEAEQLGAELGIGCR